MMLSSGEGVHFLGKFPNAQIRREIVKLPSFIRIAAQLLEKIGDARAPALITQRTGPHSRSITRHLFWLSPPTITQWIPVRSSSRGPSKGSAEIKRTRAGTVRRQSAPPA